MVRHVAAVALALSLTPSVLLAQTPERRHLTVSAAQANIYKSPSVASPVIGKAPRGTSLEITREVGDWVKVSWPDDQDGVGYVHRTVGSIRSGNAPVAPLRSSEFSPARPMPAPAAPAGASDYTQPPLTTGPVYVPPPTHFVGVGGRLTGATLGYGVSGRAWSRRHLGAQVDLVRSSQTHAITGERMTTMQFAPSVLYGVRDYVSDYMWLRPYFGGGINIHRATLSPPIPEVAEGVSESKFGIRGFGGTELTFASVPRFAFSVEVGYDSAKTPFEGYELGGLGFAVSGHWYFK